MSYREGFDKLPPGGYLTDPTQLDPNTFYMVGTLQTSNTDKPAQNGGKACVEFPKTIYVPATIKDATCLSNTTPPEVDDSYYSFGSGVQGFTIFPRFFTTSIPITIAITQTTNDTGFGNLSYNDQGTVVILGQTSNRMYYSTNFGIVSPPAVVTVDTTRTFNASSIGNGDQIAAGLITDSNRIYTTRLSNLTFTRASADGHGPWSADMFAIGSTPRNTDNLTLARFSSSKELILSARNLFWYGGVLKNQTTNAGIQISSLSLDKTVATAVSYTPATSSALATSTIYMMSIQVADSDVASAPGGIGFNMASTVSNWYPGGANGVSEAKWFKVVGNPNNIVKVCAGEDLRAFAIDDTGAIFICNNITQGRIGTTGSPSVWIKLPTPQGIIFREVYYRKNVIDTAYAIDTTGKIYIQKNVNEIFKSLFNLSQ